MPGVSACAARGRVAAAARMDRRVSAGTFYWNITAESKEPAMGQRSGVGGSLKFDESAYPVRFGCVRLFGGY